MVRRRRGDLNCCRRSYRSDLYPNASIQITSTAGGTAAAADSRLGDAPATYAFLYPNTMLNRYGPWLDTNVVVPLAPDRCKVVFQVRDCTAAS